MDNSQTWTFREPWLLKKTLLPLLQLNGLDWFEAMETLRLAEETKLKSGHSTRFLWRKGRLVKGFRTSLHGRQYNVGTSEQSCSHFNWIVQSGVDDSLHCGAMILKVGVMHMFVKTRCTCSCGTVLMMNVSTTRLSTWWVSDFEGNHGQRKSMLGESHSHNQDT
jgi:hypothetical protein